MTLLLKYPRIFHGPKTLVQSRLRDSLIWRKGFWLGSAYGFRRSAFNEEYFARLILKSPLSPYAYLDLVLGPYLAATNPSGSIGYIPDHFFLYRIHQSNSAASDSVSSQLRVLRRMQATTLLTAKLLKKVEFHPKMFQKSVAYCSLL